MSEEATKTQETPAPSDAQPNDDTISKSDHEAKLKSLEDNLASTKAELSKKELELLSPEYIAWREDKTKKASKETSEPVEKSKDPIVSKLQSQVDELTDKLNSSQQSLQDVVAYNELQDVRGRYPDFDTHREDVMTLLKNSRTELTYEQAYKIVKADTTTKAPAEDSKPKAPSGNEKPTGSIPYKALDKKEYKNEQESDQATVEALRDKYPDMGDII